MKKQSVRSFSLLLVVAPLVAVALHACGGDKTPLKNLAEGCIINTDCNSPLVCAFRKCHNACASSRDCDNGERCVASDSPYHVCQLAEERDCARNSDCPEGQTCGIDLECRDQCAADRDCLKDQVCLSGTCADRVELNDAGGLGDGANPATDAVSGQPCLYTSECVSPLVCRSNSCSYECLAVSDCLAGQDCVNNRCSAGSGTLVGAQGGAVTVDGGKLTLAIPPGALRSGVVIAFVALEAWPEGALGAVFDIQPSGLVFATPATLTYHYDASDIGATAPSSLQLATAVGPVWHSLPSTVDTTARTVSAPLEHLSVYGLIGVDGPSDGGSIEAASP